MATIKCGEAADRLLFQLHHKLDCAAHAGGRVPVGASALLGRALDEMRADGRPSAEIRRAETVSVALHRLEWIQQASDRDTGPELARVRDEVRLLLTSPAEAALPAETHAGTLFDWPTKKVADALLSPSVWLSRLRQHRLAAA